MTHKTMFLIAGAAVVGYVVYTRMHAPAKAATSSTTKPTTVATTAGGASVTQAALSSIGSFFTKLGGTSSSTSSPMVARSSDVARPSAVGLDITTWPTDQIA